MIAKGQYVYFGVYFVFQFYVSHMMNYRQARIFTKPHSIIFTGGARKSPKPLRDELVWRNIQHTITGVYSNH